MGKLTEYLMEKEHTAYHEAGHVVAHYRLGVQQHAMTIKPHGDNAGAVTAEGIEQLGWSDDWPENAKKQAFRDAENQVLCYYAGYAALVAAGYDDARAGADDDFEKAEEIITAWELSGTLDEWQHRGVAMMSTAENIRTVEFVAKALLKYEGLDMDYCEMLIDRADGAITEEEWLQFVSWQYPGMV